MARSRKPTAVDMTRKALRDSFRQFARNGRWGTCGDCPRDADGHAYPEFCAFAHRYDHALNVDELAEAYRRHAKED